MTPDLVLALLCIVVLVAIFWVLYGTRPRIPR